MRAFRKLLRLLATALVVPVLLFEEWGWLPLAALVAKLARMPIWAALEQRISALSPVRAVLVFFTPVVLLFPLKLFALLLVAQGNFKGALLLLLAAKLAGTAILARLFQLTLPALMKFPRFAHWYPRWKTWKDHVLGLVRSSGPWLAVDAFKLKLARGWRALRRAD